MRDYMDGRVTPKEVGYLTYLGSPTFIETGPYLIYLRNQLGMEFELQLAGAIGVYWLVTVLL